MGKKIIAFALVIIGTISCFSPITICAQSNTQESEYYYEQLNNSEKLAYRNIYSGYLSHKKYTQIPTIKDNNSRLRIIRAIRNDHPELYYLSVTPAVVNSFVFLPSSGMEYDFTDRNNNRNDAKLRGAAEQFLSNAPNNGTDYEKVLFVHDKLVQTMHASTHSDTSIYDALVQHSGSSSGYALTTKYLLSKLGVICRVIEGKIVSDSFHSIRNKYSYHMWNVVSIDGKDYLLDVQRDDMQDQPVNQDIYQKVPNYVCHRYFDFSKEDAKDYLPYHTTDWESCTHHYDTANYYVNNRMFFKTFEESKPYLEGIINKNLSQNKKYFEIQYGSEVEARKAYSEIFLNNSDWSAWKPYMDQDQPITIEPDYLISQNVIFSRFEFAPKRKLIIIPLGKLE